MSILNTLRLSMNEGEETKTAAVAKTTTLQEGMKTIILKNLHKFSCVQNRRKKQTLRRKKKY